MRRQAPGERRNAHIEFHPQITKDVSLPRLHELEAWVEGGPPPPLVPPAGPADDPLIGAAPSSPSPRAFAEILA